MSHTLNYLANCSMLFTETPLLERPSAAKNAGFDAIEFWWPFASAVPGDRAVDEFIDSVTSAGVQLVGLNFFAGDLAGADCGVLSIPARASEFRDNIDVAVGIGSRLGVSAFNALYGVRVDGVSEQAQDEQAQESLLLAAKAAAAISATVLIEPISGPKPYPLRTADQSVAVIERLRALGADNVSLLFDIYHLSANGDDIDVAIAEHAGKIGHVQIADAPGRGEPGSGEVDIEGYLDKLAAAGYAGWVGLEYKPTTASTVDSLGWLPQACRSQ
jgi:hydroxypyruvate isomerase